MIQEVRRHNVAAPLIIPSFLYCATYVRTLHNTFFKAWSREHTLLRLLVSIQFQDLFHSPTRGSFHLSLTVLVHYRSLRST